MVELLGTTFLIPEKDSSQLALINLIVDDGVANRGPRKALFNPEYRYLGASFVTNSDKIYSVISISQSNLEKIATPPQNIATSTSHIMSLKAVGSEKKTPSSKKVEEDLGEVAESEAEYEKNLAEAQKVLQRLESLINQYEVKQS